MTGFVSDGSCQCSRLATACDVACNPVDLLCRACRISVVCVAVRHWSMIEFGDRPAIPGTYIWAHEPAPSPPVDKT